MDRKRAFNRAFSPSCSDPFRKALRSVKFSSTASTPQIFDTPAFSFGSDKENVTPSLLSEDAVSKKPRALNTVFEQQQAFAPHANEAHMRLPLGIHSLHDCSKIQQTANSFGAQNYTTSMQLGQDLFGSSPPGFTSDLNSSSPADDVLGSYPGSEPGPVIFEDPDNTLCEQSNDSGALTPSALQFGDLSLQEVPKEPSPTLPFQFMLGAQRTNVFMMQSSVFQPCFTNILPNEVVIAFDKGKQIMKINKYPLFNQSRFFAQVLDGPFVGGQTRCIRLRDDFPYAIAAMVQFVEDGTYIFNQQMRVEHPNITLLDLHVHVYVVGNKYVLPRLCDYAVDQYINVAGMVLSMGIPPDIDSTGSSDKALNPTEAFSSASCPTVSEPNANPSVAVFNSFLDSLVLIWRNTPNREDDALRHAVLELIKPEMNNLMRSTFFQTLMKHMVGFCDDIMCSIEDDGFDVAAFPVHGKLQGTGVRFGGA